MINRSGICWTGEDKIIYGLAKAVNEYTFAEGFKSAGCHYLIQLDVNSGHSGFEYYRVDPVDGVVDTGEPLDKKSEASGEVRDRPDLLFRAKKLFRSMTLMRFPRFIQRDPRDYFYITLARLLPGPAVQPPGGEPTAWKVNGLPGSSRYPARFAMATLRGAGGHGDPVHVVQADPRWLEVTDGARGTGAVWVPPSELERYVAGGDPSSLSSGDLVIGFRYDEVAAESVVVSGTWMQEVRPEDVDQAYRVISEQEAAATPLCGAFGVGPHRFVMWAETPGGDPTRIFDALHAAGVSSVLAVPRTADEPCGWAFSYAEGATARIIPLVLEELGATAATGLSFLVADREPVVRLFPDTEIVKPGVWNPGQTKRIRYFRPEDKPEDGGGSTNQGDDGTQP
jgi:hypothetical protein